MSDAINPILEKQSGLPESRAVRSISAVPNVSNLFRRLSSILNRLVVGSARTPLLNEGIYPGGSKKQSKRAVLRTQMHSKRWRRSSFQLSHH